MRATFVVAAWSALPSEARWALVARGVRPSTLTTGDLRRLGLRLRRRP